MGTFSVADLTTTPPSVELPRDYNVASDLLERHVVEGRDERIAVIDDDGHTYAQLGKVQRFRLRKP